MSKRKRKVARHGGKHNHKKGHFFHGFGEAGAASNHHPIVHTAIETGKDLLIGVVAGGLAGAAMGKSSLLAGILVTGAGHHMKNRYVQLVGIGMMASNGFQSSSTTNGLDGLDGMKDRLIAYKNSFSQKFYLDKFLKKKTMLPAATTAGFGEVQYFTYPDALNGDLAALNDIENQLADAAMEFQGTGGGQLPDMAGELPEMSGDFPEISGELPESQVGDVEDSLY